jgi:hypothetical protein
MTIELKKIICELLIDIERIFRLKPDSRILNDDGICFFVSGSDVYYQLSCEEQTIVDLWFSTKYPTLPSEAYKFLGGRIQEQAWERKTPGYKTERADWAKELLKKHFDLIVKEKHEINS